MADSDYKWRVCVEERGFNPVSITLFASKDPAEAWAHLLTLLERTTRNRVFYVKEYGRHQRWTDFRKTIAHLFKHSRGRYYLDYRHFVDYAAGKMPPPNEAPEPEEPDAKLLMIPDIAVDDGHDRQNKTDVTMTIKRALSTQSEWSKRQKARRL